MRALKDGVRRKVRTTLTSIAKQRITENSELTIQTIKKLEVYLKSKSIAVFVSTPYELDTSSLISDILLSSKHLYLPRTYSNGRMAMLRTHSTIDISKFKTNSWGIPEPPPDLERFPPTCGIDLVILPGMAFDTTCGRLGHGKAFYDKWIASQKVKPVLLAPCLPEQLFDNIPMEETDWKMDLVVCGDQVFNKS